MSLEANTSPISGKANLLSSKRSPLSRAANLLPSPKKAKAAVIDGEENRAPFEVSAPRQLFTDKTDRNSDSSDASSGNADSDASSTTRATKKTLSCNGKRILDDEVMQSFLKELQGNDSITHLNLFNADMNEAKAIALAEALKGNKSLTYINLSCNNIGAKGLEAICKALKGSNVTHLDLSWNLIGGEGIIGLDHILRDRDSKMLSLNLAGNSIGDSACSSLAFLLTGNSNLVHLDLSGNNFSFPPKIPATNIVFLDLEECHILSSSMKPVQNNLASKIISLAEKSDFAHANLVYVFTYLARDAQKRIQDAVQSYIHEGEVTLSESAKKIFSAYGMELESYEYYSSLEVHCSVSPDEEAHADCDLIGHAE